MSVRESLPLLCLVVLSFVLPSSGQQSRFKVLAFYSTNSEPDHVRFAQDALKFFQDRSAREHFTFESTTRWEDLNDERLKEYQLVIWLNESPSNPAQRTSFERYIQHGGAWLGFHAAGYNDKDTNWPWFVDFLGGAVFYSNGWPPLPAHLLVDDSSHPVLAGVPGDLQSPANEWYVWKPSPRLNKDVRVLMSFDPANYPMGFKDVITSGDLPVVWTNTKFKMLYMNMGHGDKIFDSPVQNKLIDNAVNWLGMGAQQGSVPDPSGSQISPHGVALNPKTGKFYAVNTGHDTVRVLDDEGRFQALVNTQREPEAVTINPDTNRIYVTNAGSGSVTVIDGATSKAIATVAVGDLPYATAVNPATNKVYISRTFHNDMTVIDGATNTPNILKAGIQADAIAVDPVANKLYLIGYQNREITVIEGATDHFSKIDAGIHEWAIATDPSANKIYAVNVGSGNLMVLDGKSGATNTVSVGKFPCAIGIDESSGKIFVANYGGNSVTVIDRANASVAATVNVGPEPQALAIDSSDHRVYVTSTHAGTTTIIDGTRNSVIGTIETGKAPFAVAVNSKTHKAVVLGMTGDLTVIDGTTLEKSPIVEPGSH